VSLPQANLQQNGLVAAGVLVITAHLLLLVSGWPTVAGVLLLGVLLPGMLLTAWLLHRALPTPLEFALYSLGLGLTLYVLAMGIVAILPGGVPPWQVVTALDLLCLLLAVGWWRAWRLPAIPTTWQPPDIRWDHWATTGVITILVVGGTLRLVNLGYSEFYNDEIRVMHRVAELIQGYPKAMIVHRKGPAEVLIPTGIYAVQQSITEAHARLPFTVANMTGLVGVFLLGWRMFGKVTGWVAAMLLAVDGYFVGFARFAQYQNIVFMMSVLVVLALHRQAQSDHPHPAYLWIAGLCFVTGTYAHYEAVWVLIPALYLLWVYLQRTKDWRGLSRALAAPLAATVGLVALFYVPFILDPGFVSTAHNIFDNRIGNNPPYNNLLNVFERTWIYDSIYLILFLVLGALAAQGVTLHRIWPRRLAWSVTGLTGLGLAVSYFSRPDWLYVSGKDHTWIFFALAIGVVILPAHVSHMERSVWLWFGLPMLISLFFVAQPNTHVYCFFPAWALVVGSAMEAGWAELRTHTTLPVARRMALSVTGVLLAIFANYAFWLFTYTGVEVIRNWRSNRPWGYWTEPTLPQRESLYGFPYKNGWKVIGALYANGTLDAPYNADDPARLGDWYTRGPYLCPPEAEYYMLYTTLESDSQFKAGLQLAELTASGFREWGAVLVNQEPRLRIFTSRPVEGSPRIFDEAAYAHAFDRTATSPYFVKIGPALIVAPAIPVAYRLGDSIWLKGYTLADSKLIPGEKAELELYWQTNQRLDIEDKVFVQLINLKTLRKAAQQDTEPGCTKYSIDNWQVGDLNFDLYHLPIAPDTPPGVYTLLVGIYHTDTEERYPVFDANGSPLGNAIALTPVEVR
jgi:hypothetical protein